MNDNNGKMITRGVDPSDNITKFPKKANSTSSWTRLKDPRIVCLPRAFGGKDRHSKVVTLKGLRDRRVRLSVPTALQLYDLGDKLGLDQPSKVVEWLLKEAKHEINKLPQLQMPPLREDGLPLTELLKLMDHPTTALSSTLRKDEETMVVSDEDGVKLDARNLDLINHLKGNSNSNSFNFGLSYQNDFLSRPVSLGHSGSNRGVEEIQNFNVMAALPSTMYNMPLSSQVVVYSPAGLPQYVFHPQ